MQPRPVVTLINQFSRRQRRLIYEFADAVRPFFAYRICAGPYHPTARLHSLFAISAPAISVASPRNNTEPPAITRLQRSPTLSVSTRTISHEIQNLLVIVSH